MAEAANGAVSALPYSAALDTPANKKFVAQYNKRYGKDPSWAAQCSYISIMFIVKALERVKGKVDRASFLASLKSTELKDSPRGPLKLDAYGNPIENIYVRKVEKVSGKFQNTVIHTFPMVSQFWKFKPADILNEPTFSKDLPPCRYCSEPARNSGGTPE